MTESNALARETAAPLAQAEPKKSMLATIAERYSLEPAKFFAAVKACAGCEGAKDEHFMVLLMQAEKYKLDPLSSPPMLQILNVGKGPEVYARLDAWKVFLQRAEDAGELTDRAYKEDWYPDPRVNPSTKTLRRGGKLSGTINKHGKSRYAEKIVWFDEWGGKGQWQSRGSHMLESRAQKEFCRDNLGYVLSDVDDAERIKGTIDAQATVSDSPSGPLRPSVPIASLKAPGKPELPPAPLDLDEPPQETVPAGAGDERAAVTSAAQPASETPAPAAPFDESESLSLDAELAAEDAKRETFIHGKTNEMFPDA